MKIAICEDDSLQAGALEKMLKKRFEIASYENSIDVYLSAEENFRFMTLRFKKNLKRFNLIQSKREK